MYFLGEEISIFIIFQDFMTATNSTVIVQVTQHS